MSGVGTAPVTTHAAPEFAAKRVTDTNAFAVDQLQSLSVIEMLARRVPYPAE
jgi:hypothetical protein